MEEHHYHDLQKVVSDLMDAGIRQEEMAKECHCSQSTISKIHKGKIKGDRIRAGIASTLLGLHTYHCKIKKA